MGPLACVDLPALPLQILLRSHPEWSGEPVAVVDEDRPQGIIEWVNERARRLGVLPGLRYATALSLAPSLRAGVVPANTVGAGVAGLTRLLRRGFSPHIEPSVAEPGVFWIDASGLGRLHPSLRHWARLMRVALRAAGFRASVAVGFTRFGTYAVARSLSCIGGPSRVRGCAPGPRPKSQAIRKPIVEDFERRHRGADACAATGADARQAPWALRGLQVFTSVEEERAAAGRVPLDRLGFPPELRDKLARLGVTTVTAFLALPAAGLLRRFGSEAHRLHRLANDELFLPLAPVPEVRPAGGRLMLEAPESAAHPLLFQVKRLLDPLLSTLAERGRAVAGLHLTLKLDHAGEQTQVIRPATPSLDAALLLDLVRLRLEAVALPAGVEEMRITLDEAPAEAEQLRVFATLPRRDRAAASRALARVRAELGDAAVGCYVLREGHLPEASFGFVPLERVATPRPQAVMRRPLVRRLLRRPLPLPFRGQTLLREDGWQPRDREQGPIEAIIGPYIVSGGWWQAETHRSYAFARTQRGDLLWVFYDRRKRRWLQQGRVD